MADDVQEKKPKPIGTPAPNVSKPKSQPAPAPKQQLLPKSENSKVGNVKVKPGSPFKSESVPVGVQQKPLESQKHVEKRVDKMFKDTNQPTLGVWNKNNTHPMSDPDSIRFNPNLKYKPTKEQLEAANRKRIMNAGFAPKSSEERSKLLSPKDSRQFSSDELNKIGSTNVGFDKNKSYAYDVVKAGDKYHVKGYRNTENNWPSEDDMEDIEFKDANGNSIDGFNSFDEALEAMNKGGYPVYDNLKGQEKKETPNPFKGNSMPGFEGMGDLWDNMMGSAQKVIDNGNNSKAPASEAKKKFNVTLDGDHLGEIEAADEYEAERLAQQKYPGHPDDDLLSVEEQQPAWDKNNEPGSGVTTQELENWTRDYLKKDGDLSDEFIEKTVSGLHTNSKQADFYKSKMKEEYERSKASELFGTDLNKSPKRSEQDLRDFENSHPFEVEYDYDENGNRNGYELKFSKPEDQEAYEKLLAEVYGGK